MQLVRDLADLKVFNLAHGAYGCLDRHAQVTGESRQEREPKFLDRGKEHAKLRPPEAAPRNKDIFATSALQRLAAKASYLIRDPMKAMGYSEEAPAPCRRLLHGGPG